MNWFCMDRGWNWPLADNPPGDAECDNYDGQLTNDPLWLDPGELIFRAGFTQDFEDPSEIYWSRRG